MPAERYAALTLQAIEGGPTLPLSPAFARRICLGAFSPTGSAPLSDAESPDWLLCDPTALLWAVEQSPHAEPTLASLQAWLTTASSQVISAVVEAQFQPSDIAACCEQLWGTATPTQAPVGFTLEQILPSLESWPRLGRGVSGEPAPRQVSLDWQSVWNTDPAWSRMLLSLHQQAEGSLSPSFDQRLQQEKLLSMKQLAYGASHEINNPLANIATRAQTLLMDETDPQRRRTLATINQQAFRAHEMIADMMLFAMPPQMAWSEVELRPLIEEVIATLQEQADENGVQITLDCATGTRLAADETQLIVALRCLCQNGIEAMPDGGSLAIQVAALNEPSVDGSRKSQESSSGTVSIAIGDDGPGLTDHVRRHLFDPFFSGREAGRGLGFGLSKAWRIVTEMDGHIAVNSPSSGGTEFVVTLPVIRPRAALESAAACDKVDAPLT